MTTSTTKRSESRDTLVADLVRDIRGPEADLREFLGQPFIEQWVKSHRDRFRPVRHGANRGYMVEIEIGRDRPHAGRRATVGYWTSAKSFETPENRHLLRCAIAMLVHMHPLSK